MPVSNDIQQLMPRIDRIEAPMSLFCDLLSIAPATMSRARNGAEHLHRQDLLRVRDLLEELEELCARSPLKPNWKNVRDVRIKLEELRAERRNPPEIGAEDINIIGLAPTRTHEELAAILNIPVSEIASRISESSARMEKLIHFLGRNRRELEARRLWQEMEEATR